MILLDTDTLTLLFLGNVAARRRLESARDNVATTIISRIEMLRGRFDAVVKAADAKQLQQAFRRLVETETQLATWSIVPIDYATAEQFEKLLRDKKLKKIGRGDLLIASIALAHRATLVTRNLRDFEKVPGLTAVNWLD